MIQITLLGFLCSVIPFVLIFSIYGTSFSGHVDPWWCFLESASYLTYRILDEMDGKQARKTGNSSPLGLLFDHGCDSLTAGLLTLVIVKAIQCGNNYMVLLVLMGVTQSFYFCTLEEYYIGGLFLGIGNGVTDASFPIILMIFLCGYPGYTIFGETVNLFGLGNLTGVELIVFGIAISQTFAVLFK